MIRKGNLSQALNQFDRLPFAREEEPDPPQDLVPRGKAGLPPSRQGKKALTGYFDPGVLKQLKVRAATQDTTIHALMSEALNDLFKKHGKPHIA